MGQELQRRAPGTVAHQSDPSWPTVVRTTARLWLDRHYRRRHSDLTDVESVELVEDGPLTAAVRVTRTFGKSRITQVLGAA